MFLFQIIKFYLLKGFGMIKPVGHMDFYPNSGQHQPGCDQSLVEDFLDEGLIGGELKVDVLSA